ncbi:hypothetical protein [Aquisalimonas sp.]|uniref:anti-sigma factor family protein n=1 Tax=unclassified Aquisalimonas TaxID=2644645 RepID=UPI0025C6E404|nr:hypothetical protein [Aquisalimonas sp.]
MDCRTLQHDLDALLAGDHGEPAMQQAHQHLANCPACRAYAADVQTLRRALADDAEGRMPTAVRQRLLPRRTPRPALAAAAAVIMAAGTALVWQHLGDQLPGATTEPAEWTTATVRLDLQSGNALSDVQFQLELPEGTQLEGHPDRRSLTWHDDLAVGSNQLTIPLILTGEPQGELVARLEHDGKSRELRLTPAEITRRGVGNGAGNRN